MKKFFLLACLALASTSLFAQKGTLSLGYNINFGLHSDYKNVGLGAKLQYEFVNNVRGEASFNYFFKKDGCTMWDANVNFHYLIRLGQAKKWTIYPLAGVTLLGSKVDLGGVNVDNTRFGGNFGAGVEYPVVNGIKVNAEAKYQVVKDWNRPVITVGMTFDL